MDTNNNQIDELTCRDAIMSEDFVDYIVQYEANIMAAVENYNAFCFQIIDEKFAILHTPIEEAVIEREETIVNVLPRLFGPYGIRSIDASGILPFHEQPYLPLRGEGILIGFVDSGIDYRQPAFVNDDNTSKILSIWDQTIQEGDPPLNFQYGTEYTQLEINEALNSENPLDVVPSIDETGHGTFMAGIAAGREIPTEQFVGAAPDAEVIMVKLKPGKQYLRELYLINEGAIVYQDTDVIRGVQYIIQQASIHNRPVVICLGIGSNQGAHDGTSITEEILDDIGNVFGYTIVVPAGNEANLGHHNMSRYDLGDPYEEIEVRVAPNEQGVGLQIWAQSPDVYSVAIISPTGEFISRLPPRLGSRDQIDLLLERTTITIEYLLIEQRTGDQLILVALVEPTEGIWTIRIYGDIVVVGTYHIWLEREGWIYPSTQFLTSTPSMTVTIPSTGVVPITVGAYNHVDNSLYIGSGRGPTRDNRIKPELVAPGVNVLGPLPNNEFGRMTGTSVASAHVAGAAALLLEWGILLGNNPNMNTRTIKKTLVRGATRREQFDYPNNRWGYGTLNLLNSFEIIRGTRFD
ncbi:subtilase family protein [Natranaerovirga hydrolytica]|uniref:Subtilase family protein n=1 Tax=Natranaerovirga hydrolytica TaxID=680378 RepID=A0A4R1N361_9FIRM|nr:S8 family peptidase [Natranaerovirga hydrolytica]TCK98464.1 subtilase family protein [Natranaerovirga hydrolytica]